jgi:plasmid maintenance system killer protein
MPFRLGDLAGHWSITARANWRIIFRSAEGAILPILAFRYVMTALSLSD